MFEAYPLPYLPDREIDNVVIFPRLVHCFLELVGTDSHTLSEELLSQDFLSFSLGFRSRYVYGRVSSARTTAQRFSTAASNFSFSSQDIFQFSRQELSSRVRVKLVLGVVEDCSVLATENESFAAVTVINIVGVHALNLSVRILQKNGLD